MLHEIGDELRRTREARGLTLRDVQAEIKIRLRYLEALEEGDLSAIPGEVYARGFLRSYAQLLGMDTDDILTRYRLATGFSATAVEHRAVADQTQSGSSVTKVSPKPTDNSANKNFSPPGGLGRVGVYSVGLTLAFLAIIGVWFYFLGTAPVDSTLGNSSQSSPPEAPSSPPQPSQNVPSPQNPVASPPLQKPSPSPAKAQVIQSPADPYQPFLLNFEVVDPSSSPLKLVLKTGVRCWYEVVSDGRFMATGTLEAGTGGTWEARDKLSIRLGDPRQLEISINGIRLPVNPFDEPITIEAVRKR